MLSVLVATQAHIFGRNCWLNMTERKWESEVGDASRHSQITSRMHQISLFLHLVLVISLASFCGEGGANFTALKVCGLINLTLTMKQTISNSSVILICRPLTRERISLKDLCFLGFFFWHNNTDLNKSSVWHVSAAVICLQIIYQFHAFLKVSWHRWTYSRIEFEKMRLPAATNNEKKMNQGARVEKHAICTDQLSQWEQLGFNVFEGKLWCAMSLSSFQSVSIITLIFLNQIKMRNEFNNTCVRQPCL